MEGAVVIWNYPLSCSVSSGFVGYICMYICVRAFMCVYRWMDVYCNPRYKTVHRFDSCLLSFPPTPQNGYCCCQVVD